MKDAKIKITSQGDGWRQVLEKPCRVDSAEDIKIFYVEEGDDCTITLHNDMVYMSRRGSAFLDLSFLRGKTTICTIGTGGGRGEVECRTGALNIKRGKMGLNFNMEYSLGGTDISLSATIIFN